MKAPDKIYAMIVAGTLYADTKQHEVFNKPYAEYIRKDALLEWLEGKMTIEGETEGIVGGYDFALKDVIKHIESL